MRDLLLPCSIFSLAVAIALHAVMPAHAGPGGGRDPLTASAAEDEDEDDDEDGADASARGKRGRGARVEGSPSCRAIRLGTIRDYERHFADLYGEGRRHFLTPTPGLICGW